MSARLLSALSNASGMKQRLLTFTNSAQERRKSAGLSTCSMTSIEQTTSKRWSSSTNCSAVTFRYVSDKGRKDGSFDACTDAIPMFDADASIPSVLAPSLARLCCLLIGQTREHLIHDEPLTTSRLRIPHPKHSIH